MALISTILFELRIVTTFRPVASHYRRIVTCYEELKMYLIRVFIWPFQNFHVRKFWTKKLNFAKFEVPGKDR